MSMKKTDLYKNLAKKIGRDMKSEATPERFAKGSKATPVTAPAPKAPAALKPVQLVCRLPADLVRQLRERALHHEGGVSALVAQALSQHLGVVEAAPVAQAAAKKADAKKPTAKKVAVKKTAAKKAPAKKVAAEKVVAKKAAAKKVAAKKAVAKKAPAKKAAATRKAVVKTRR
jgi:hypothetical protein